MRDYKLTVGELFVFVSLFLGILPAANFMGLDLPIQYLLLPIFVFVLLFVLFKWIPIPKVGSFFMMFWLIITFEVIFSGIFSPLLSLGKFNLPTETFPYIARLLYFVAFIVIFYNYKIDNKKFMNMFIIVLIMGMGIGVLQFFNWPGSHFFRDWYTFSDRNLVVMFRDSFSGRRISGVAHFATATGGIAAFTFVMIISMSLFYKKQRVLTLIGLMFVGFNVLTAQARMGYLTVVFSIIIFYFIYNKVMKSGVKSIKSTFFVTMISGIIFISIFWLYQRGNEFITKAVFRWEALGDQLDEGGNRLGQIKIALEQLDHPFKYLFGIARGGQQAVGNYMEIEPVNILMLYGGVGFVLQYSLVLFLLIYFYKNIKVVKQYPILLTMVIASFVGLLSYQFFSAAYFFFREIYVGIFPWILMGATIGVVERFKINPENFEKEKKVVEKYKKRKMKKIVWKQVHTTS